ncbi:LysR family transcriptional regulator [Litoribrevibacter albus]|uniref:Transcriptional regulator n=1 Tax=Litoribrevibacter albus TaxID=1473156 RepID=A0AA37S9V6_9GAMM|nr:LysR family transcriptional regulator [Litoribrevibacter albus]GLQ31103.1 transcriptional regulator [Litoribrevibacter albus]
MTCWDGISEFVCVIEQKGFTAAAQRLKTSPAQISRKVAALEARLAVKLINRTTRKVSLTEAGQLYYQECKALVSGLENADLLVSQMQSKPKGLIKLTAPVTYGEQIIAPLVNDFLVKYPDLEVELILTNQKLDLIDQGIDLAIRLGQLKDSSFIAKRLANRRLHVCATPKYLDQCGTPYALSELSQHNCLMGTLEQWRFKEAGKTRNLSVHGRIKCNSGPALLDAARKHLGLAQLPDFYVAPLLASGELVEVLSSYQDDSEAVWALYPQRQYLSPKMQVLLAYISEQLA